MLNCVVQFRLRIVVVTHTVVRVIAVVRCAVVVGLRIGNTFTQNLPRYGQVTQAHSVQLPYGGYMEIR